MPPESLYTHNFVTEKLDCWALGCFILEIFSEQVPWYDIENLFQTSFIELLQSGGMPKCEPEGGSLYGNSMSNQQYQQFGGSPGNQLGGSPGNRSSGNQSQKSNTNKFKGIESLTLRNICKCCFAHQPGMRPSAGEVLYFLRREWGTVLREMGSSN